LVNGFQVISVWGRMTDHHPYRYWTRRIKAKAIGGESKDPKPSENQNDQMGPGAEWTVRVTNSLIALNIDFLI